MFLPEFDTLRARHPSYGREIIVLEMVIVSSVRRDEKSRLDLPMFLEFLSREAPTERSVQATKRLLVELVKEHALQPLLFWECPNGGGPVFETEQVASFPDWIECDRCNQIHWFDQSHVEVGFVATAHLISEVAAEYEVRAHERLNERRDAS